MGLSTGIGNAPLAALLLLVSCGGESTSHCDETEASDLDASNGTPRIIAIEAGWDHVCTIDSAAVVSCWGGDQIPESVGLPEGSEPTRSPNTIPGMPPTTDLALGSNTSCALHSDATASCWGWVDIYQYPTLTVRETPRAVAAFDDVHAIGVLSAWGFPCALRSDGAVRCAVEMGATIDIDAPASIALSTSGWFGCGLHEDGTATCFEADGDRSHIHADLSDGIAIADGWPSCSVHRDGRVTCVDGSVSDPDVPLVRREVVGLADPIRVEGSNGFACAITHARTVVCWGNNGAGQLGVQPSTEGEIREQPVEVSGLCNVVDIAVGGEFACALDADGEVTCWGDDSRNQWGNYGR